MTIDPIAVLATLTLEQKVTLLAGFDGWHTIELPGVPALRCSDGPAGVRGTSWAGPASASFPCGTALGATFDPDLVEEVGAALGREARSKGAHVLLAPTVNLHRTPIGGRNFECMSEDPTLTAHIAVAYVKGVQSMGVAACIKHFVANDTEFERHTISSEVDERTMRELYLVPFEAAVRSTAEGGAGVRAVMSSYNRIAGTYASENAPLLRGVLRDEWGFDGVVFSDWFGTHGGAASLEAGLDLEMPGPTRYRGDALLAEVLAGAVSETRVDESVLRLLQLFSWSGVGEVSDEEITDDSSETRAVIRRAAIAATVLLKNDGHVLPLARTAAVALVGPNSERGQIQGGGSARVRANRPVPILGALRERGVSVTHAAGCSIAKRLPPVRGEFEIHYLDGDGEVVASATAARLDFLWMDGPVPGVPRSAFGARIAGSFTPEVNGEWSFGLTCVGAAVLRVDGEVVIDLSVAQTGGAFFGLGNEEVRGSVSLEAGVPATIEVEHPYRESHDMRGLLVGARPPVTGDSIGEAVLAAAAADVAVVVVGTDHDWETEGEDRTSMDLPGRQDELIARVAAVNPHTVVVINAGSPVSMPWIDQVAGVMQIWFPGEEIGNVVADLLLGDAEPGGRLPVTLPRRLAETPAYLSHPGEGGLARYDEGQFIGYRWYDARGIEPLFPFGHGLGYTDWTLQVGEVIGAEDGGVVATVSATNIGRRAGSTVVQVYVAPPVGGPPSSPRRPVRELRGFARVSAEPGQTIDAVVWLPERAFATWSVEEHGWRVPPGNYGLFAGTSSRELMALGEVVVGGSADDPPMIRR